MKILNEFDYAQLIKARADLIALRKKVKAVLSTAGKYLHTDSLIMVAHGKELWIVDKRAMLDLAESVKSMTD